MEPTSKSVEYNECNLCNNLTLKLLGIDGAKNQIDRVHNLSCMNTTRYKRITQCWNADCGSPKNITLNKCARCKVALYCGQGCQLADWHKQHKRECTHIKPFCDNEYICIAQDQVIEKYDMGNINQEENNSSSLKDSIVRILKLKTSYFIKQQKGFWQTKNSPSWDKPAIPVKAYLEDHIPFEVKLFNEHLGFATKACELLKDDHEHSNIVNRLKGFEDKLKNLNQKFNSNLERPNRLGAFMVYALLDERSKEIDKLVIEVKTNLSELKKAFSISEKGKSLYDFDKWDFKDMAVKKYEETLENADKSK